jgi:hypothetical protein
VEEEELRQQEAALTLVDFIYEGIQDLQEMGVEVDWADVETLGNWLRKDQH